VNRQEIAPGIELLGRFMGVRFPVARQQDEDLDFAACRFHNFPQDQCDGANWRTARANQYGNACENRSLTGNSLQRVGVPTGIVNPNRKHWS
jgi:hypothetical protein